MKSIEQQVADVMERLRGNIPLGDDVPLTLAAALSRAGLLATERDVLCRGIADGLAPYVAEHYPHGSKGIAAPGWKAVIEKVEALAAYDAEHAPKPRYFVEALGRAMPTHGVYADGHHTCVFMGTEAECTAVAAALNALAEKEAARG